MEKIIKKELSSKVLMIGEYFKNSAPGGMAAVLASYDEYFEDMKFIPTWKNGGLATKLWYAIYSYIVFMGYMLFDRNIKIVHIQGAAFASFERNIFFVKLGKVFGKKVIMHMHCADFESYYNPSGHKRRIIDTINACDSFFVLSDSWKDYFTGIGVDNHRIVVLNNTITPPQFRTVERSENKLHLLYLGVIGQRKGIYDILKVLEMNSDYYRNKLELRIGGNQEEEKLKRIIHDAGLESFVKFEGFVKGDKKTECLNWCDVYILPSFNEGLPIAILEAMAYGHPVVSTPVGGIPVVVRDGENGILVEPGNCGEIDRAIRTFTESRELVEQYGRRSAELVKPFLPETVFETLTQLYNDLLR
ncbi:MAG: glycosyltransferase family 4 protein [Bacteroidales bacterium]|nr:glycosyltransferase family 4 protein [Bacteroidales bacterium]MCM1146233.1 glycosyltransferase family 4 protein [Bacteroidales bacterium]MCM1205329.1 glycosyltransferase family 4 protein [Bacillota bacterium]MCM1509584.1 glycosyltransferase family 4 protein [Clostridium sp.]